MILEKRFAIVLPADPDPGRQKRAKMKEKRS
jgi:hypothetical protein